MYTELSGVKIALNICYQLGFTNVIVETDSESIHNWKIGSLYLLLDILIFGMISSCYMTILL